MHTWWRISALYNLGSSSWLARANGAAAQTAANQLHALTYNVTRVMQLADISPLQSTTPGLHPVSIHQTSLKHPITAYYSIYRPRKHERLSWPSWLTCSGRFTHKWSPISCRSSAWQGKFAGQRSSFYHCATPPSRTILSIKSNVALTLLPFFATSSKVSLCTTVVHNPAQNSSDY